ncbi:hypothetical protein SAMN04488692_10594 [Halarsenatibacter silvermanii]|uniref:Uncharacterized protein n=1 Tax=Halarsenatibacter silvermanii TaxID=321763 RepID=A0A1G9KTZ6_9FIRM|nr:hypothetical protein SAMN04488692_10594 [Halarsenatibacter silvermanii]
MLEKDSHLQAIVSNVKESLRQEGYSEEEIEEFVDSML